MKTHVVPPQQIYVSVAVDEASYNHATTRMKTHVVRLQQIYVSVAVDEASYNI